MSFFSSSSMILFKSLILTSRNERSFKASTICNVLVSTVFHSVINYANSALIFTRIRFVHQVKFVLLEEKIVAPFYQESK